MGRREEVVVAVSSVSSWPYSPRRQDVCELFASCAGCPGRPPRWSGAVSNLHENLFISLAGSVSLPGARCRNRSHLFDAAEPHEEPETVAARHGQAISLCNFCPSLQKCGDWLDSLSPSRKPSGVVAGRVINIPKPRKKPNSKENKSA